MERPSQPAHLMRPFDRVVRSVVLVTLVATACALVTTACARRNAPRTASMTISTLTLRSADETRAGHRSLSCRGDAFCREDVLIATDADAIAELTDDCTRRGGKATVDRCARAGVVAACLVTSGEHGPIAVFTYHQASEPNQEEAIAKVAELCDAFDGFFEEPPR